MAFDALNYPMSIPYAMTQPSNLTLSYTTANVVKKYTPGQLAFTWDPCWGFRIFKLVKNLNGGDLTQGQLVSNVAAASVGTITAGTTDSIVTSGLTANDLEYQMLICTDDYAGAGGAPEGEAALCIGNTTTHIYIHPQYVFTTGISASDTVYVVYTNAVEQADDGEYRGTPTSTKHLQGVVYGSSVSDNEWFWILQKGWARVANTDVLTANADIKQGTTSGKCATTTAAHETVIGQSPVAQNDGSFDVDVTVYINCFDVIVQAGDP